MTYRLIYELLRSINDPTQDSIPIPESSIEIRNASFVSRSNIVLPGAREYACKEHGVHFTELYTPHGFNPSQQYHPSLDVPDCDFKRNTEFRLTMFKPAGPEKSKGIILLFHGFNEKFWDKYLPWAYRLAEQTGKTVVLFPIAFHMNRSPAEWSDPKSMKEVSELRKKLYPTIAHSSFANAAISTRLHMIPQRFFWSGLQTYSDIVQFIQEVRSGRYAGIDRDATVNLFAYSIGSFLAELLLMSNPEGLLTNSRLFMFCGGPTLDRMYPVSKYIMDSEAAVALYSFFIEHLDNEFKRHSRLSHYFGDDHASGIYFKAMLSNPKLKKVREQRFNELAHRIRAFALLKDEVIPPAEILNTLKGDFRDIPIEVEIADFPYAYSHMNPFPITRSLENPVDEHFRKVFDAAAMHLGFQGV